MELQNQLNEESTRYFCNWVEGNDDGNDTVFDTCSPLRMDGNSNPYCNFWTHSYSGSYVVDARIRLDSLKSGSSSPAPTSSTDGPMYSYDFSKDIWEIGIHELSALDEVDLIDVEKLEENEENEESWLYVSPKSEEFLEQAEPALSWCRHVLDNRSPEMEAACRQLINRLNLNLSHEHRHTARQQTFSFDSTEEQAAFRSAFSSNTFDYSDQLSPDSNYRLQNITDVYDLARIQEASLRQEYVYTPRGPESPLTLPPSPHTTAADSYNITHGNRSGSSSCQSSSRAKTEKTCLSPKVTRLHQYKVLKRAQNQGSSNRTSSPLRTSLRSLQAVRSSRSLDIEDFDLDKVLLPRPVVPPARTSSRCRSSSRSFPVDFDVKVQSGAIKRCQRSHSLSPCRIPKPPLSPQDKAPPSTRNSRAAAWARSGRQLQR